MGGGGGGGAPFFWWRKMVALGELLTLPVAIFTTIQLGIDNSELKYWYDDHSCQKSLQVEMDISISLSQIMYHGFFFSYRSLNASDIE